MSDQSTFSLVGRPARTIPSQDLERDWMEAAVTSRSNFQGLLIAHGPDGWSGKTSPVLSQLMKAGTLEQSLPPSAGDMDLFSSGPQPDGEAPELSSKPALIPMGSPGACLTLNISEFPSGAAACSLSDILEIGAVPQRFYLSAIACKGILRRAENRGKALPALLMRALESVASQKGSEGS